MSAFTVVVTSDVEGLCGEYPFNNEAAALAAQKTLIADLVADGWAVDCWADEVLFKGDAITSVDVEREVDEENESPWGEAEQGWRNIRQENAEIVARQNREDAEYARRPQSSYHGVRGTMEPDGTWIYEP